jgi:hypothetical protein
LSLHPRIIVDLLPTFWAMHGYKTIQLALTNCMQFCPQTNENSKVGPAHPSFLLSPTYSATIIGHTVRLSLRPRIIVVVVRLKNDILPSFWARHGYKTIKPALINCMQFCTNNENSHVPPFFFYLVTCVTLPLVCTTTSCPHYYLPSLKRCVRLSAQHLLVYSCHIHRNGVSVRVRSTC